LLEIFLFIRVELAKAESTKLDEGHLSHDPIYFCRANVGAKVLEGETRIWVRYC
jgi:hypothetical protein